MTQSAAGHDLVDRRSTTCLVGLCRSALIGFLLSAPGQATGELVVSAPAASRDELPPAPADIRAIGRPDDEGESTYFGVQVAHRSELAGSYGG